MLAQSPWVGCQRTGAPGLAAAMVAGSICAPQRMKCIGRCGDIGGSGRAGYSSKDGDGTSYATTHVSGAAVMWLAHHGKAVDDLYGNTLATGLRRSAIAHRSVPSQVQTGIPATMVLESCTSLTCSRHRCRTRIPWSKSKTWPRTIRLRASSDTEPKPCHIRRRRVCAG